MVAMELLKRKPRLFGLGVDASKTCIRAGMVACMAAAFAIEMSSVGSSSRGRRLEEGSDDEGGEASSEDEAEAEAEEESKKAASMIVIVSGLILVSVLFEVGKEKVFEYVLPPSVTLRGVDTPLGRPLTRRPTPRPLGTRRQT